jgi:peptidylprolyl isomerase
MKSTLLLLFLAAGTAVYTAQAPAQTAAKPASAGAAKPVVHHATATAKPAAAAVKLPPGVAPVAAAQKTLFALQYQDIAVGTGAEAEANKLYKVHYTGWLGANGRADDGRKFDSSLDRPGPPLQDADGKPVLDENGQPKLSAPQPFSFPQGYGQVIPGWDQGFGGMKVGGKRRLFIPWQLAYGAKGRPGPDAGHPGIPPKADLIFDIELVDVAELPARQPRPGIGGVRQAPGAVSGKAPSQPAAVPAPPQPK